MLIEAYKDCWSETKINHNLDLFESIKPDVWGNVFMENSIKYAEAEIEKVKKIHPKNYSTQECESIRNKPFDPSEEGAVFDKLAYRIE